MLSATPRPRHDLTPLALVGLLLLVACGGGSKHAAATPTTGATSTQQPTNAPPATAPAVTNTPAAIVTIAPAATPATTPGFSLLGRSVNPDAKQAGLEPALAVGAATAGDPVDLWIAWAENTAGAQRQIFVSELVEDVLAPRGASLNIHQTVDAHGPTIGFAGENRTVP